MSGGVMEGRAVRARELRAQGLLFREIAERLGVSVGYAKRLTSPALLESSARASLDAKRKRQAVCACGKKVGYYGAPGKPVSDRCVACANAEEGLARRGSGRVTEAALEFLAVPRRQVELQDRLGISEGYVSVLVHRLLGYGLVRRVSRGVYVAVPRQDVRDG